MLFAMRIKTAKNVVRARVAQERGLLAKMANLHHALGLVEDRITDLQHSETQEVLLESTAVVQLQELAHIRCRQDRQTLEQQASDLKRAIVLAQEDVSDARRERCIAEHVHSRCLQQVQQQRKSSERKLLDEIGVRRSLTNL